MVFNNPLQNEELHIFPEAIFDGLVKNHDA